MATSEAQKRATKKYRENNKERTRYTTVRRNAKAFTTIDERQSVDKVEYLNDLKELKEKISKKIEEIS